MGTVVLDKQIHTSVATWRQYAASPNPIRPCLSAAVALAIVLIGLLGASQPCRATYRSCTLLFSVGMQSGRYVCARYVQT